MANNLLIYIYIFCFLPDQCFLELIKMNDVDSKEMILQRCGVDCTHRFLGYPKRCLRNIYYGVTSVTSSSHSVGVAMFHTRLHQRYVLSRWRYVYSIVPATTFSSGKDFSCCYIGDVSCINERRLYLSNKQFRHKSLQISGKSGNGPAVEECDPFFDRLFNFFFLLLPTLAIIQRTWKEATECRRPFPLSELRDVFFWPAFTLLIIQPTGQCQNREWMKYGYHNGLIS